MNGTTFLQEFPIFRNNFVKIRDLPSKLCIFFATVLARKALTLVLEFFFSYTEQQLACINFSPFFLALLR